MTGCSCGGGEYQLSSDSHHVTDEVIFVADALVEIQLGYADRRRVKRVVDGPQRSTCCVADAWRAVAGDAVRLTGTHRVPHQLACPPN